MNMIERLKSAAVYASIPCPVTQEDVTLLVEIHHYLAAAAEGSMSRNNSEQIASELLYQIERDDNDT